MTRSPSRPRNAPVPFMFDRLVALGAALVLATPALGAPARQPPAAPPGSAQPSRAVAGQAAGAAQPANAGQHGCEAQVAAAAKRYDIPLAVFYAVGLLETGGRNGLQPYSMNIEGRSSTNATLADALATFETARRRGASLIDVGCMQINYRWHGKNFASVTEMFDPAHNVDYAARFLHELKLREKTWTLAVARYNAGPNNNAAQKQYVCGVIRKMVNSGFGSWTANARNFCGEPTA